MERTQHFMTIQPLHKISLKHEKELEEQNNAKESSFARPGDMDQQHLLLLEKTHQFPASTLQLTHPMTPVHPTASAGLPRHYTHARAHTHHTHILKNKIFF